MSTCKVSEKKGTLALFGLNTHMQPFNKARDMGVCLKLPPVSYEPRH